MRTRSRLATVLVYSVLVPVCPGVMYPVPPVVQEAFAPGRHLPLRPCPPPEPATTVVAAAVS